MDNRWWSSESPVEGQHRCGTAAKGGGPSAFTLAPKAKLHAHHFEALLASLPRVEGSLC